MKIRLAAQDPDGRTVETMDFDSEMDVVRYLVATCNDQYSAKVISWMFLQPNVSPCLKLSNGSDTDKWSVVFDVETE